MLLLLFSPRHFTFQVENTGTLESSPVKVSTCNLIGINELEEIESTERTMTCLFFSIQNHFIDTNICKQKDLTTVKTI